MNVETIKRVALAVVASVLALSQRASRWWLRTFRRYGNRGKLAFGCGSLVAVCFVISFCGTALGILPTATPQAQEETPAVISALTETAPTTTPESVTAPPTNTVVPTDTPVLTNTPAPTDPPTTNTPIPTSTLPPPTNTLPPPLPTNTPPLPLTETPLLTEPPPPSPAQVIIVSVNKGDEYVDIRNIGGMAQDLADWRLVSETGNQECHLGGVLQAGQVLRIWAMAEDAAQGGYNCNFGNNIWNNSESDPAALYDASGNLVDRK